MNTNDSVLCDTANSTGVSGIRTIQIHPTLRCNLTCRHCYSFSSPSSKNSLSLNVMKPFLEYAFQEGFNAISFSGGEPMLYPELEETLSFTKSIGFNNAMVTNGMLLGSTKAKRIISAFDLVVISIDGKPELHDYIRGQKGAFQKMLEGVEVLQNSEINFGFIHTISNQSWGDLLWIADFAFQRGAKLLQLHPLENAGRTNDELSEGILSELNLHKAFIIANYLKTKYEGLMDIQLDLSHKNFLESTPESFGIFDNTQSNSLQLRDIINNIVIDETGTILPIAYGISKKFTLGNITNFDASDNVFNSYVSQNKGLLSQLYDKTYQKVINDKNVDLVNWSELIIAESYDSM